MGRYTYTWLCHAMTSRCNGYSLHVVQGDYMVCNNVVTVRGTAEGLQHALSLLRMCCYSVGPEHGNGIIIPLMYCITYPPVSCPGLHSTLYLDVTHSCCSPVLHLVTPPLRYAVYTVLLTVHRSHVCCCAVVLYSWCCVHLLLGYHIWYIHLGLSLSCIWEWIRLLFNSTS